MANPQPVQIVTIYSSAQTKRARARIRLLALLSMLVAAVWLLEAAYPRKVFHRWNTVDRWIKGKLMLAALSQSTDTLGEAQRDPWVALGLSRPENTPSPASSQNPQELENTYARHLSVLVAGFYLWKGLAILAGAWLALAALFGLLGRRISVPIHRQAAALMILSTLATVAAIYIAIRWGGMPKIADPILYAKIAAIQSVYAWFLLIATRWVR